MILRRASYFALFCSVLPEVTYPTTAQTRLVSGSGCSSIYALLEANFCHFFVMQERVEKSCVIYSVRRQDLNRLHCFYSSKVNCLRCWIPCHVYSSSDFNIPSFEKIYFFKDFSYSQQFENSCCTFNFCIEI